ncbi:MAG TPA: TadE/TadG family type IV pilus assembly protein [Bryobacteraceae bacterium]|jgi:Flp pilus assembly protein TadG|nr:TadE/TadG family type IV pilus assembly protein [Bryobacteraceae bacterium]
MLTAFRRSSRYRGPANRTRGSAVVEISLIAPWFLFLFIGVVDMGFYCYDLIAVENAARVAAEYTSTGTDKAADSTGACTRALAELASLSNMSGVSSCNGSPLTVTATSVSGLAGSGTDTKVNVTYQTQQLIPIPGLLQGQFTFSRTVRARVKT